MAALDPSAATAGGLTDLRHRVNDATARLLGTTIGVDDGGWRAPSRLAGWTRGHVATHVARQADGLARLAEWACTGQRQEMYASAEQRDGDIEAGAGRGGLEIQVDLDSSAGRLSSAFDAVEESQAWNANIQLRGGTTAPARMLPLARLTEIVLHHVDLGLGFTVDDLDEPAAEYALEWCVLRLQTRAEFPSLEIKPPSDRRLVVGAGAGPGLEIRGSSARLLGWLTGRCPPDVVEGANGLVLPPY